MEIDQARRIAPGPERCPRASGRIVVIGCGNLLRGDDAVGPTLVRRLVDDGVPDGVTLVDGGTTGMNVAFSMRGARKVVLIDAASTGAEPGTIYRIPGSELEHLPSIDDGLHTHDFRWDHALSFGRWLLGDSYPEEVVVYLVEIARTEPGAPLSDAAERAMQKVRTAIRGEWGPAS